MSPYLQVLAAAALLIVGGPVLVELVGYFWHREAEHMGRLGDGIRYRHWVHHEREYPTDNLRPKGRDTYRVAGSWSWFLLAGIIGSLVFIALPIRFAAPLTVGGMLYAWFVVNYFHRAFHIDKHWLNRFGWFRRLVRLHDIHHWEPGNYGIVFFAMDRLFGTYRAEFPPAKKSLFPGFKPA